MKFFQSTPAYLHISFIFGESLFPVGQRSLLIVDW